MKKLKAESRKLKSNLCVSASLWLIFLLAICHRPSAIAQIYRGATSITLTYTNAPALTIPLSGAPVMLGFTGPIADLTILAQEKLDVFFDASTSWDPRCTCPLGQFDWDFGDGTKWSSTEFPGKEFPIHTFPTGGIYAVNLTVTGYDGAKQTAFQFITVTAPAPPPPPPVNQPPIPQFTIRAVAPTARWYEFDASASRDPDGTIIWYYWEISDGTKIGSFSLQKLGRILPTNGVYEVRLGVYDDRRELRWTTNKFTAP